MAFEEAEELLNGQKDSAPMTHECNRWVPYWGIAACVTAYLFVTVLFQGCRIYDLEHRVTTFETIRIEAVAPPEGGIP